MGWCCSVVYVLVRDALGVEAQTLERRVLRSVRGGARSGALEGVAERAWTVGRRGIVNVDVD